MAAKKPEPTTVSVTPVVAAHPTAQLMEFLREQLQPFVHEAHFDDITALIAGVPTGYKLESIKPFLDECRQRPERRAGTTPIHDLDTFITFVNRQKAMASSVLFANADRSAPKFAAVFDYHDTEPGWRQDRAVYAPQLSEDWKFWHLRNGHPMSQAAFAELLDDRILDVVPPPTAKSDDPGDRRIMDLASLANAKFADAAKLVELGRSFAVHATEKVAMAQNLATGEVAMSYENAHGNAAGKVDVPGMFCIAIPVFQNGDMYRVLVRLRYRLKEGVVSWFYQLHRTDQIFDDAFKTAALAAKGATGLPLFYGTPE